MSFASSEGRRRGALLTRIPHAERLLTLWESLKTSFWFVPSVMSLGAFALLWVADVYDNILVSGGAPLPWFIYVSTAENVREILSTILSSMITMASLVFSVTMVVLSLAANQFGPRLIRSFMASPQTQFVLGTFVMTIVYCLVALASIGTRAQSGQLPYSSVSIAVALTVASVALLVFFVHTLARSIVSETVIERVGAELDALCDELPPLEGGRLRPQDTPLPAGAPGAFIGPARHGYVQAVEFSRICGAARAGDAVVTLQFRAGDYLAENGRSIMIAPAGRASDELKRAIRNAIVVGRLRTPVQDPEAVIQDLEEIAVRALSPGVNDPFTAISVINRLSVSLAKLFTRELPTGICRDQDGIVRVAGRMPTHGDLLSAAFDQIRLNGAGKPIIVRHLLDALSRIADATSEPSLLAELELSRQAIWNAAAAAIGDAAEIRKIKEHADALRHRLT